MAKKRKNKRPPLLTFLLREFSERLPPLEPEKQRKDRAFLEGDQSEENSKGPNLTHLLLSCLSLNFMRRADPSHNVRDKPSAPEFADEDPEESESEMDEEETENNLLRGRFEVLPSNPLNEDYLKRAGSISKSSSGAGLKSPQQADSQVQCNADNYRQMYLHQRAQESEMTPDKAAKLEDARKKDLETAAKKVEETRNIDNARLRARELQNKIAWWRMQSGVGQYDDATINLNVDLLQRELGTIPPAYW